MAKPYGRIYNNNKNVSITPLDIKDLYPVGSIYLSINKTNPSTYFGGTWEQIYGGYLYMAQNSLGKTEYYGWGTQGHTLTIKQIPSHNHIVYANTQYSDSPGAGYWGWDLLDGWCYGNEQNVTNGGGTRATGGGGSHSHDIATVDVFAWKRTA